jgi:hypothetical protein
LINVLIESMRPMLHARIPALEFRRRRSGIPDGPAVSQAWLRCLHGRNPSLPIGATRIANHRLQRTSEGDFPMTIELKPFAGQNWAITPVALAAGKSKPASIKEQQWQVVLTGVVVVDFAGNNANDWRRDTLWIYPDIQSPLRFAINRFSIPTPIGDDIAPGLELDQWAPFAAVSSTFSREQGTVDAGFAVDDWRPHPFFKGTDFGGSGGFDTKVFQGIDVDIAVRNNQAVLHRVSYHITLVGRIVFPAN